MASVHRDRVLAAIMVDPGLLPIHCSTPVSYWSVETGLWALEDPEPQTFHPPQAPSQSTYMPWTHRIKAKNSVTLPWALLFQEANMYI